MVVVVALVWAAELLLWLWPLLWEVAGMRAEEDDCCLSAAARGWLGAWVDGWLGWFIQTHAEGREAAAVAGDGCSDSGPPGRWRPESGLPPATRSVVACAGAAEEVAAVVVGSKAVGSSLAIADARSGRSPLN